MDSFKNLVCKDKKKPDCILQSRMLNVWGYNLHPNVLLRLLILYEIYRKVHLSYDDLELE